MSRAKEDIPVKIDDENLPFRKAIIEQIKQLKNERKRVTEILINPNIMTPPLTVGQAYITSWIDIPPMRWWEYILGARELFLYPEVYYVRADETVDTFGFVTEDMPPIHRPVEGV